MTQVFSTKLYYVDLYLLLTIRLVYMYYKTSNIYVLVYIYIYMYFLLPLVYEQPSLTPIYCVYCMVKRFYSFAVQGTCST